MIQSSNLSFVCNWTELQTLIKDLDFKTGLEKTDQNWS